MHDSDRTFWPSPPSHADVCSGKSALTNACTCPSVRAAVPGKRPRAPREKAHFQGRRCCEIILAHVGCTAAEGVDRFMCNSMNHQESSSDVRSHFRLPLTPPSLRLLSHPFAFLCPRCEQWGRWCDVDMQHGAHNEQWWSRPASHPQHEVTQRIHRASLTRFLRSCCSWSRIPAWLLGDISSRGGPPPPARKITRVAIV